MRVVTAKVLQALATKPHQEQHACGKLMLGQIFTVRHAQGAKASQSNTKGSLQPELTGLRLDISKRKLHGRKDKVDAAAWQSCLPLYMKQCSSNAEALTKQADLPSQSASRCQQCCVC